MNRFQISRSALALVSALGLQACEGSPPSDQQMIDTFKNKRAVFEKLASDLCAMSHEETIRVDGDTVPTLPPKELQRYYALLKEIGSDRAAALPASVNVAFLGPHPCSVEVSAWSRGILDGGDYKSWVTYPLPDVDGLILKSLDDIDFRSTYKPLGPGSSHGHRDYLRHLDGIWWLEWDHWE